ncbi:phytoene/squalene synthase family protein [Saccharopolyspora sp. CA-218241]|uniref:phytoene/squalene synthase family protein n=1 Tax=Saccharopolyspora sp. CA-218241 TaxID=3240027 RepID=UPI003D961F53
MRPGPRPSANSRRELDAAGVRDARLRAAYLRCRRLNALHGRTYFLATRMLTARQRPAVHALYGFARWVDDVVDDHDRRRSPEQRDAELDRLESVLRAGLRDGGSTDPVVAALVDTTRRYAIDPALFDHFLTSMRMDLSVREYPDRAALDAYVHGSAAVIGLQVLPVLGTVSRPAEAAPYAAALGRAFQLTNFIRDVGEDLDRGRVYLPADELAVHGVDRDRLQWCRRTGRPDRRVRRALSEQVARVRADYRAARPGIELLAPESRPCVATAHTLYGEILDRVVESGYAVFGRRVSVPRRRRAGVALAAAAAVTGVRARALLGR